MRRFPSLQPLRAEHTLCANIRLRGALMLEQNYEWVVCRRYVSLESIAAISHGAFIGLPGVVA